MSDDAEQVPGGIKIGQFLATVGKVAGVAALGVAAAGAFHAFDGGAENPNGDYINKHAGQIALIGSGVGIGSYILGSAMNRRAERITDGQIAAENQELRDEGWAAKEQERAIMGLMKARVMATNPEYFAQMQGGRNV